MASEPGYDMSRIEEKRRWEDYTSLKQYYKGARINEYIISGYQTTTAAYAELDFLHGGALDYAGAELQIYIRCEADDSNQDNKYVYVEYCDDDGLITTVTGDISDTPDSTTEVELTDADNFYRLRRMSSEVESAVGGGKSICLTDDDMAGFGTDMYGFIDDGQSDFIPSRYFVPAASEYGHVYLGRIIAQQPYLLEADATPGGVYMKIVFTPKALNLGEEGAACDKTTYVSFSEHLDWEPCIELEPATEVKIYIKKLVDADHVTCWIEATFLEVA